jgi:hypothetical protein
VQITSLDVIHSFWVPRLAGKLDAIPGHVNVLRIEADLPGIYAGVSAEFSGTGYRRHSFVVMAHDAEAWATSGRRGAAMNVLRRHRALVRIWASDPGWRGWFTTVNHTDIGRMFLAAAVVFFFIGGILAMLIRVQLATPRSPFMGPEIYNQIFTMHGTIMMFLFAIPLFEGLAVYLLPKLLGARDLAFPRLTAYGYWCYVFGGSMLLFRTGRRDRARTAAGSCIRPCHRPSAAPASIRISG